MSGGRGAEWRATRLAVHVGGEKCAGLSFHNTLLEGHQETPGLCIPEPDARDTGYRVAGSAGYSLCSRWNSAISRANHSAMAPPRSSRPKMAGRSR